VRRDSGHDLIHSIKSIRKGKSGAPLYPKNGPGRETCSMVTYALAREGSGCQTITSENTLVVPPVSGVRRRLASPVGTGLARWLAQCVDADYLRNTYKGSRRGPFRSRTEICFSKNHLFVARSKFLCFLMGRAG
jgi:hypothetical protein